MVLVVSCLRNTCGGSIHGVVFAEQLLRVRPYTRLEMGQGTELKIACPLGTCTPVWGFKH